MTKIDFLEKYCYVILFFILAISAINIFQTLPKPDEYSYGADEGTYYRQATTIKQSGLRAFKTLANDYITNPNSQLFPPPTRIVHIILASIFLYIDNSIISLSYLSLASFIALCIILFLFIKRYWGLEIALASVTLITFSPLACSLARRALMESDYNLFSTLALISLINFLDSKSSRHYILLVLSLTVSLLIKEITLFLIPFFFIILLFSKYKDRGRISWKQISFAAIVPPLVVLACYSAAFGGVKPILAIYNIVNTINNNMPHQYILDYNSGPWYEFFIDYFLMSPLLSILFFLFLGDYITNTDKNGKTNILLAFFIYFILCFSFLPKNIRYAINLNFIYILFATLMLVKLASKYFTNRLIRDAAIVSAVIFISFLEVRAYNHYFITNKIYDPVAFNLLKAERMIPVNYDSMANTTAGSNSDKINEVVKAVLMNPTAENYLNLSFYYYQTGRYSDCIDVSRKVLELKPDSAEAYNNICAAYNGLREWDKAIEAANKALQINPDFQLAKNNLEWAKSQKAKGAN